MNEEQEMIYVRSQILCTEIEMQGMIAENQKHLHHKLPPKYSKGDFDKLINKYNIHHNGVLTEMMY